VAFIRIIIHFTFENTFAPNLRNSELSASIYSQKNKSKVLIQSFYKNAKSFAIEFQFQFSENLFSLDVGF